MNAERSRKLPVLALAATLALATACTASGPFTPQPFPRVGGAAGSDPGSTPVHDTSSPRAAPGDGYAIAGTALALRGAPYREGGTDPGGFDCSGLIHYVFLQHGIQVPRQVAALFRAAREVAPDDLQPGDLVFFSTKAPGASHVGMSIGGDEFVHAPSAQGVVRVERMSAAYWSSRIVGARRIVRK